MKKVISILLVLVIVVTALPLVGLTSFAVRSGDWEYTVQNNEATITKYNEVYSSTYILKVPTTLGEYPVASIGENAFDSCYFLSSITIPNGVKSIGNYAFANCTSLQKITIPATVSYIGVYIITEDVSVVYQGTPKQWNSIELESDNYFMVNNPVYYPKWHVTNLKSVNYPSGVKLSWTAPKQKPNEWAYKEGFAIYRKTASGSYEKTGTSKSTYFFDKTAKSGTKYTYAVKPYLTKNAGDAFGDYPGATDTGSKVEATTLRLAAPSLKLLNVTAGVKTSWNKVTGAKGYNIYRKDASSGYKKIASTTSLSYVDKTAKAGVNYTYAVRAYNGSVLSGFTSVTTVRLTNPAVKLTNTKSGPKATWSKIAGAKGYMIYRKTSSGSYSKIATTTSLSYVDKTAKKNVKYYYAVKAYNGSYVSAYTAKAITVKK